MLQKIVRWTGLFIGSCCLSALIGFIFPSLPARFAHPGLPFRYVVTLADSLAMVEQVDAQGEWTVLDSAWSRVQPQDCHCPALQAAADLAALQRYSNLEQITLTGRGSGKYLLQASRDDLGGPQVGYLYACDSLGWRPLLRYDSFFGITYPVLGWRYFWGMAALLLMVGVLLTRLWRRQASATRA